MIWWRLFRVAVLVEIALGIAVVFLLAGLGGCAPDAPAAADMPKAISIVSGILCGAWLVLFFVALIRERWRR